MGDNGGVTYTTKELLASLDSKLDKVLEKLEQKADKSQVESLETRLTTLERHGSPGLAEVITLTHDLTKRLGDIEHVQLERAHLVKEHAEMKVDVSSLKTSQTRITLLGGLFVLLLTILTPVVLHYLH